MRWAMGRREERFRLKSWPCGAAGDWLLLAARGGRQDNEFRTFTLTLEKSRHKPVHLLTWTSHEQLIVTEAQNYELCLARGDSGRCTEYPVCPRVIWRPEDPVPTMRRSARGVL
jgi:hypothetical protein